VSSSAVKLKCLYY